MSLGQNPQNRLTTEQHERVNNAVNGFSGITPGFETNRDQGFKITAADFGTRKE
jgi:hypothetical protein